MNPIQVEHQEIPIRVGSVEKKFLLRTPAALTKDPALLINLAGHSALTLDDHPYRWPTNMFLAAGHRVASFDLPCHGEWKTKWGDQLVGIAAAMAAGVNLFEELAATGRATIDACIERKLARAGHVVSCGTSRGALSALHVLAGDPRVSACAMFAPATYLPAVAEFAKLDGTPIAHETSAHGLVEKVAGRPVAISTNTDDQRVSTEQTMRFYAALRAAAPATEYPLYTISAEGHGITDAGYHFGTAFLLNRCALTSGR